MLDEEFCLHFPVLSVLPFLPSSTLGARGDGDGKLSASLKQLTWTVLPESKCSDLTANV